MHKCSAVETPAIRHLEFGPVFGAEIADPAVGCFMITGARTPDGDDMGHAYYVEVRDQKCSAYDGIERIEVSADGMMLTLFLLFDVNGLGRAFRIACPNAIDARALEWIKSLSISVHEAS